jgi:iron complex outermembrane receptor protein
MKAWRREPPGFHGFFWLTWNVWKKRKRQPPDQECLPFPGPPPDGDLRPWFFLSEWGPTCKGRKEKKYMARGFLNLFLGFLLVLSESLVSGPILWAAETAEVLPELVVTATKTERSPEDVPASITVITSKDIERQNIQLADEALKQVPSTFTRRGKGWMDTMASVNLRGFPADSQKRTLVLLDGQDISTGYTNRVTWSSIPVENIERIEVVRGPFSALYGGTAMGGVINIITKTPKKLEMQTSAGYASYDTWNYYMSVGNRWQDKVSFQVNYKYMVTDGYPANLVTKTASKGSATPQVVGWQPTRTTTGSSTYIIGDTGDNSWFSHVASAKVSWDVAPGHKINFFSLFNWNGYDYGLFHSYLRNSATGAPVFSGTLGLFGTSPPLKFSNLKKGTFLSGNGREFTQVYHLDSEHRLWDTTILKLRAGFLYQPDNWYTTPDSTQATARGGPGKLSSTPSYSWGGEMQLDHPVGTKQLFTGGLVYKKSWAGTEEFNLQNWTDPDQKGLRTYQAKGSDHNLGLYLQDEITWHPKFTTVLGMRLDWWQTYGGMYQVSATAPKVHLPSRDKWSLNPKFALLYRPWDRLSLRASVGTAFRPPNVYELYRTWVSSSGQIYKGNPSLKPERNLGWEAGVTLKLFKGNTLTATVFQNFVDDLIYRVTDPADPSGKTSTYQNAAKAQILGLEMEVTQKLFRWLEVFGNTTLLDPRIRKNPLDPNSVGKNITYVPRQQFNCGLNLHYGMININLTGHYVSKLYTRSDNRDTVSRVPGSYDPFFTLDAKLTVMPLQKLNPALGKSFVSVAVNNILDRRYFYYYLTPGRTVWTQVGLKY